MEEPHSLPFHPDIFKMGHFILYRNQGGWVGDAIEERQGMANLGHSHAQYTHVECSGGGIHSILIAPPRARLINISNAHKGKYVKLVKFIADDYDIKRYKVAYFSAALCANKGYDFSGVFSFLFKWVKQSNRLYFCSEGCAAALQMVYPRAFYGDPPSSIMPAQFSMPLFFETVWEGIIPKVKT